VGDYPVPPLRRVPLPGDGREQGLEQVLTGAEFLPRPAGGLLRLLAGVRRPEAVEPARGAALPSPHTPLLSLLFFFRERPRGMFKVTFGATFGATFGMTFKRRQRGVAAPAPAGLRAGPALALVAHHAAGVDTAVLGYRRNAGVQEFRKLLGSLLGRAAGHASELLKR
jgi:hypothetical protein